MSNASGDDEELSKLLDVLESGAEDEAKQAAYEAVESLFGRIREELAIESRRVEEWIDREAKLCPEDVGIEEYVHSLEKRVRRITDELKSVEIAREIYRRAWNRSDEELAALRSSSLTPRQASALRYVCEDYQDGITPEDLSPEEIKDTLEKLRTIAGPPDKKEQVND